MYRTRSLPGLLVVLAAGCDGTAGTDDVGASSDAALVASALSAAPDHIAATARVVVPAAGGELRTLRPGTGEYTCMPDNPDKPGNMPMCFDRAGLLWMQALRMRQEPPADAPLSIAYALQGTAFPSFSDPDRKEPAGDRAWVETGPILMIMNVRGMLDGYPVGNPDPDAPFVMYEETPWEHVMIPVRAPSPRASAH